MSELKAPKTKMDSFYAWGIVGATLVAGYFVGAPVIVGVVIPAILKPAAAITAAIVYGGFGGGSVLAAVSAFVGDKNKTLWGRMKDNLGHVTRATGKLFRTIGEAYSVVGADLRIVGRKADKWAEQEQAKQQAAKAAAPATADTAPKAGFGKRLFSGFGAAAKREPANTDKPAAPANKTRGPGAAA